MTSNHVVGGSNPSGSAKDQKNTPKNAMEKSEILGDLREQFGPVSVLYADQLAQVLGKSTDAVYALHKRKGLPFRVLSVGGRPAVSILAVADWLAKGAEPEESEGHDTASGAPAVPAPKRKHEALGAFLRNFAEQRNFLADVYTEVERIVIASEAEEADQTNEDLGREGPI